MAPSPKLIAAVRFRFSQGYLAQSFLNSLIWSSSSAKARAAKAVPSESRSLYSWFREVTEGFHQH